MASRFWIALATLNLAIPFGFAADTTDTRLLSMPALSAKNIAFVYADDLWIASRRRNPRRLTRRHRRRDLSVADSTCSLSAPNTTETPMSTRFP
jgi:hypothetical protein